MDITTLTDEQLAEHLDAVLNEQERRRRLANVPRQIASLTALYVADGGDRAVCVEAANEPAPAAEEGEPVG
jgi:hypothetical protein